MIRRSVKIQLVAFALISLLGIFYVGANYVGFHFFGGGPYTVTLVLPESGARGMLGVWWGRSAR